MWCVAMSEELQKKVDWLSEQVLRSSGVSAGGVEGQKELEPRRHPHHATRRGVTHSADLGFLPR